MNVPQLLELCLTYWPGSELFIQVGRVWPLKHHTRRRPKLTQESADSTEMRYLRDKTQRCNRTYTRDTMNPDTIAFT
jgi:hypothetical protein